MSTGNDSLSRWSLGGLKEKVARLDIIILRCCYSLKKQTKLMTTKYYKSSLFS